ncbi:MAG: hypothetical protein A2W17_04305 [Planctomycetes bacterium RBG_16_41_13]|nr:MAG: hypothetical protein A2W17_04305 [Planctomycetes bacterium RBG_16_41_13]
MGRIIQLYNSDSDYDRIEKYRMELGNKKLSVFIREAVNAGLYALWKQKDDAERKRDPLGDSQKKQRSIQADIDALRTQATAEQEKIRAALKMLEAGLDTLSTQMTTEKAIEAELARNEAIQQNHDRDALRRMCSTDYAEENKLALDAIKERLNP